MAGSSPKELLILDSSDINSLLGKIQYNERVRVLTNPIFKFMRKICFSKDDNTLSIMMKIKVLVYDLLSSENDPVKVFEIPNGYGKSISKF
jgi:hypothetical protein